jgi:hypothetical protein
MDLRRGLARSLSLMPIEAGSGGQTGNARLAMTKNLSFLASKNAGCLLFSAPVVCDSPNHDGSNSAMDHANLSLHPKHRELD